MRNRVKYSYSDILLEPLYDETPPNGPVMIALGSTGQVASHCSVLEDTNNGKRRPNSACTHRTVTVPAKSVKVWQGSRYRWYESHRYTSASDFSGGPGVSVNPSQANAVRNVIDQTLSSDNTAPMYVRDLPEARRTVQSLEGKGFGLKSFSNRYLAYKFGILPFVGDLTKLAGHWSDVREHIRQVDSTVGTVVKGRVTAGSVTGHQTYQRYDSSGAVLQDQAMWRGSVVTKVKTKVMRRYTTQDTLNAYADRYTGNIGSLAWDLIPYSFVVGWFIDVKGILEMVVPKHQVPMAQLVSATTCIKAHCNIPITTYDSRYHTVGYFGDRCLTYFHREPVDLTPNTVLGGGLDIARTATGLALIFQRL